MKIKRLIIKNIGMVKDISIELNKPLILFYGDLRQGKSTILNAVKFCFGGSYPTDLIRHGEIEAKVCLEFEGGSITREWYKGKDGQTHAREVSFIQNGKSVKKPVKEIEKFLNPFLLDQDYLRKMPETERKLYMTQLFGVDTSEIDKEMNKIEADARDLRAKIRGYGEIDLTEVKPILVTPLQEQLASIRAHYQKICDDIEAQNKKIVEHNTAILNAEADISEWDKEIEEIEAKIQKLKDRKAWTQKWLEENPRMTELSKPQPPDNSAIETQISEAAANQVRVELYQKNLKRAAEKEDDERNLGGLEAKQRQLKKTKIAALAKISEKSGIKNLSFDEYGNFVYEGVTAGMLSTSQIMKLSSELSAFYPEGLGIDLIDRAESLGKSIFLFVDRAEREKKTILATIVGEKPAKVPENVGVFVVDGGEVLG